MGNYIRFGFMGGGLMVGFGDLLWGEFGGCENWGVGLF